MQKSREDTNSLFLYDEFDEEQATKERSGGRACRSVPGGWSNTIGRRSNSPPYCSNSSPAFYLLVDHVPPN